MPRNPHIILSLYLRALAAAKKAVGLSKAAVEFNHFGRQLGWRLIRRLSRDGFAYLVNPVSAFRYFEFPFALSAMSSIPGRCLDISSPRLFSFYVSEKCHPTSIWMINPDKDDIQRTARIVKKLKVSNIRTSSLGIEALDASRDTFDTIWSISVIEHIYGKYDDQYAIKSMYSALSAGGHLILTIPVDRQYWEDYRREAYYNIPNQQSDTGEYFFQRLYDKPSIWRRLVNAIGVEPSYIRWFGEKQAGHYFEYEKRWISEGYNTTVDDPVEMSNSYQEFSTWEMMPGMGVCGMLFVKPDKK